jgi:hypothetical protein
MANSPRYSKALCDELAQLASGPEAARIGKLLQSLEPHWGGPPSLLGGPLPAGGATGSGPEPIAEWLPQQVDGELRFVRPQRIRLLDPWGTTQSEWRVRKEPGQARVCYLGESVATGLHYAPDYSFGKIMAAQLNAAAGPGSFDFVDLSMAGLIASMVPEMFRQALQLQPDVVILMLGNNWLGPLGGDPLVDARMLREGGYRQMMADRLDIIRSKADETMRSVAELARGRNTRVIVVVPENNMVDYSATQPVSWLPGDGSARWHALHERALAQLAAREYESAAELARQMEALDGGTCSTSQRLRALALAGLGRNDEAREAFRAEATCVLGNRWILQIPRIGPPTQDVLRRWARTDGFSCIDLPALLRTDARSSPPGRETFYDYCHFTVDVMRRVAAHVVLEVCQVAGRAPAPGTSVESLMAASPELPATTDAAAKLGAALGNAMISHEVGEVARYWGEQAVKASSGILSYLVDHLEMVTGATPAILTQAWRRLSQSPYKKVFWEFPLGGTLEMLCELAGRVDPRTQSQILEILQRNLGLDERPLDLSQFLHMFSWSERFMDDFELGQRGDDRLPFNKGPLHRSPWPTSRFFAVHDGKRDVHLELTARLPAVAGGKRSGTVAISINGHLAGEGAVGSTWSKFSVRVPASAWRAGPNRVALHWPTLPAQGEAALQEVAERWEEGRRALPFPIFGEVFSLTARTAPSSG